MKCKLLLAMAMLGSSFGAFAQVMPYTFSYYNQAYVPLDSATRIDSGVIWDGGTMFVTPVGFHFLIDTINCPDFIFNDNTVFADTGNFVDGFIISDADFTDRGIDSMIKSKSPVRYKVTGPAKERIFKTEYFSAGFDLQFQQGLPLTDSVNFQVWFYEDSGTVEIRFGPSLVSVPDYFQAIGQDLSGYGQHVDTNGNGYLYVLKGNPAHPTMQTVHFVGGAPTTSFSGLDTWPPNGTVYRYTRKNPINLVQVPAVFTDENVDVFPTVCTNQLTVRFDGNETPDYNIISISGENMNLKGQVNHGTNRIDVSNLAVGTYLLHLQGGADSKVFRFVKM